MKSLLGVVAHICNPIYLGGREQKDCSSEPGRAKLAKFHLTKAGHVGPVSVAMKEV
jgi:hypothetical protein